LRAIVGQISLDFGQISVFGQEMSTTRQPKDLKIGFMPQEVAIFQDLTVYENLKFFARLYNLSDEFFNSKVEILQMFKL
jgi:ABC-2 type transport system ATP-binding protein